MLPCSIKETEVIDPDVQHLAELFAAHAALALGFVRRDEELTSALATRKTIGQAIGIVMERFHVEEHQAFGYLRRLSSTTNVKLRDLAADIVDPGNNRTNPDLPAGSAATTNGSPVGEH